jgi:hypothetical protein
MQVATPELDFQIDLAGYHALRTGSYSAKDLLSILQLAFQVPSMPTLTVFIFRTSMVL